MCMQCRHRRANLLNDASQQHCVGSCHQQLLGGRGDAGGSAGGADVAAAAVVAMVVRNGGDVDVDGGASTVPELVNRQVPADAAVM